MYFCNLDKLKLTRTYNFQTFNCSIPLISTEIPISKFEQDVKEALEPTMKDAEKSAIEPCIDITLAVEDDKPAEDSEIDAFLSLVNVILLVFTEMNMTGKGRKREHRLGLANTKLQGMHISQNLLKEMVNDKTRLDVFNIVIHYRNLIYDLCQPGEYEDESSN